MTAAICFISETGRKERPVLDPSVRYRCHHPGEVLQREGKIVAIYSAGTFYEDPSYSFDVYVFHRPNVARNGFSRTLEMLKRLGKIVIADYDDLIFGSEEVALQSSAVKNNTLTPEKAVAAFASNLEALLLFDRVTVSTRPLAERVSAANPDAAVRVEPNFVPDSTLRPHLDTGTAFRKRPRAAIGYFAGTRSHDRDLPIVEDVLHRVLLENHDSTLLVMGPVRLPRSLSSLTNVVTAQPVAYWRLPYFMSLCDTVIAPLEESAFNACKSRVKFLEAALSGCRLVATPIPDMVDIGAGRLVAARSRDDWYEALSEPEDEAARSRRIDANLRLLEESRGLAGLKELGGLQ